MKFAFIASALAGEGGSLDAATIKLITALAIIAMLLFIRFLSNKNKYYHE
jgi:hypothetical protein